MRGEALAGLVGSRVHPADAKGELHIVAVAPSHQRQGVGHALVTFAEARSRAAGMAVVMVETVGDSGSDPPRRACEAAGYEPRPVAGHFKRLDR